MKHFVLIAALLVIANQSIAQEKKKKLIYPDFPELENFRPTLESGLPCPHFAYSYLFDDKYKSDDFDFTEEQIKKLSSMRKDLAAYSEKAHELALKTHSSKFMKQTKKRVFGDDLIRVEAYKHYKSVRKVLAPHQRKRLEQLLTWSSCSSKNRFAYFIDPLVVQQWNLDPKDYQNLHEAIESQYKLFQKELGRFKHLQKNELLAAVSKSAKQKYLKLIDPKHAIESSETADFPPFSLLMSANREVQLDVQYNGDQMIALPKICHELGMCESRFRKTMNKADYDPSHRDIFRFEIYKKEIAPKIEELFSPEQLAAIQRNYIKDAVEDYGPALAIFDPPIAAKSGISMAKLKSLDKLRKKLKLDEREKRIELSKAGFESVLKKVDRETRAKIKKTFGKPPKYVLAR